MAGRIEQRSRLRAEDAPGDATVVVRGGRDSVEKLRTHALRTARAWSLDGDPLLGVSVFVALDQPVAILLRERFVTFRVVHLTTVVSLRSAGFDLLPTGLRPHFTVRLERGDDAELADLYRALGPERDNPGYGWTTTGRKEG